MNDFMNMFSFLEGCNIFEDNPDANTQFTQIVALAFNVVRALQILVPMALIIWGTIDFGKSVIEGDEKKIVEKRKPFIQRIVSAIIVFFIPWIVGLVTNMIGAEEWKECWNAAKKSSSYTAPTSTKTNK